ncbi:MAG: hypothetical protein HYT99_06130 [Candidatus Tectomicrobia bacterium]|nr:hypothetical protein [Candidatus Tectomicrobia bacterium]
MGTLLLAEDFRPPGLEVAPHEQIQKDQILEVRAAGLGFPGQVQRQGRIAPVQFRRLDEPLGAVDGIRRQADGEKAGLQHVQEAVDLGLAGPNITGKLGLVEEPPNTQAGRSHNVAEGRQVLHPAQRWQITLEIGLHIP